MWSLVIVLTLLAGGLIFVLQLKTATLAIASGLFRSGTGSIGQVSTTTSISTGVIRNATANPLEVADGVRALLPQIQRDLPASVKVVEANDNSVFIDRSIKAVYTTVAEAVVLVALVVFVFLRTLRASIIPLVAVPVSWQDGSCPCAATTALRSSVIATNTDTTTTGWTTTTRAW